MLETEEHIWWYFCPLVGWEVFTVNRLAFKRRELVLDSSDLTFTLYELISRKLMEFWWNSTTAILFIGSKCSYFCLDMVPLPMHQLLLGSFHCHKFDESWVMCLFSRLSSCFIFWSGILVMVPYLLDHRAERWTQRLPCLLNLFFSLISILLTLSDIRSQF